jgi:hypothetical protein
MVGMPAGSACVSQNVLRRVLPAALLVALALFGGTESAPAATAAQTVATSTSAGRSAGRPEAQAANHGSRPAPRANFFFGSTFITFEEFEEETVITNQYASEGVVFAGPSALEEPEIAWDESNPTAPVLSGSPRFHGPITAAFVVPGTATQAVVNGLSVDVGYLDDPGDVHVVIHTVNGDEVLTPEEFGINTMESAATGILGFTVEEDGEEEAGFAIDNLTFDPGVAWVPPPPPPPPAPPAPPVTAPPAPKCAAYLLIDSRGSGEANGDLSKPGKAFKAALGQALKAKHDSGKLLYNYNSYPAVSIFDKNPLHIANGIGAYVHQASVGAYAASVRKGEEVLQPIVEGQASSPCASTQMILLGYSQGAQVTANVVQQLPGSVLQHVAAVVLFADPLFNSDDHTVDRGQARPGLNGVLGKRDKFGHIHPLVLSYCKGSLPVDPICHYSSFSDLGAHHGQHSTYWQGSDGQRSTAEIAALAVAAELTKPH